MNNLDERASPQKRIESLKSCQYCHSWRGQNALKIRLEGKKRPRKKEKRPRQQEKKRINRCSMGKHAKGI